MKKHGTIKLKCKEEDWNYPGFVAAEAFSDLVWISENAKRGNKRNANVRMHKKEIKICMNKTKIFGIGA